MSCRNRGGKKEICDECGVPVSDLARHKRRDRCGFQHQRRTRIGI